MTISDARRAAQQHVVPPFTTSWSWHADSLPVIVRGVGAHVWDAEGRRYLDGLSGLFRVNAGYGRDAFVAAGSRQLADLAYASTWDAVHPPTAHAAVALAERAPGDLDREFFVNSGSEAVESALKLARCYHLANGEPQRQQVIARDWACHGTSLGALCLTGVPATRAPFEPWLGDWVHRVPHTLDDPHDGSVPGPRLPSVRAIEDVIDTQGPDTVAMIIAEPVQNGRDAVTPAPGYWSALRALCDRHGILLCADEVITGFGRCGGWFAVARENVVPDLLTFAKAAASGYAPVGGVLARRDGPRQLASAHGCVADVRGWSPAACSPG